MNVTETTGCSYDGSGVCTVGVTGLLNYTGAANFDFTISDIDGVSELATANITINP